MSKVPHKESYDVILDEVRNEVVVSFRVYRYFVNFHSLLYIDFVIISQYTCPSHTMQRQNQHE